MSQFSYRVQDFPTRRVNQARFESEIHASSIVVALDHIDLDAITCTLWFKADLSNPDQATLDGLVAVHSGEPLPPTAPQEVHVVGTPIFKLDAPTEADGKPNFVPVPFTQGLYMFITSRGDELVGGAISRGTGAKVYLAWDGATGEEEREALATFHETVELHDGHVDYDPDEWDWEDEWSIFIRIPASEVTSNGSNLGNCNLYMAQQLTPWDSGTSYSQGDLVTHNYVNYVCIEAHSNHEPPNDTYWLHTANVIIPAAGDGAFDLTKVVAVPYEDQGYWDYNIWTDALTPHGAGGDWMLFDFQLDDVYMVRNLSASANLGFWELDAYKVEPIYPRWKLGFKVKRPNHATRPAAKVGGHFTCFRKTTT